MGKDRLAWIVAAKGEKAFARRDAYLFAIHARLDANDDSLRVVLWNVVDRLLHGAKLTRTISGNDEL